MDPIIAGVLANTISRIVDKTRPYSFFGSPTVVSKLRQLQLERLDGVENLRMLCTRYLTNRSLQGLEALGDAFERVRQMYPDIRKATDELANSEGTKEEMQALVDAELRLALVDDLHRLGNAYLTALLNLLNPPPSVMPSRQAVGADRVAALLDWAEGPGGCGLAEVAQMLTRLIGNNLR